MCVCNLVLPSQLAGGKSAVCAYMPSWGITPVPEGIEVAQNNDKKEEEAERQVLIREQENIFPVRKNGGKDLSVVFRSE